MPESSEPPPYPYGDHPQEPAGTPGAPGAPGEQPTQPYGVQPGGPRGWGQPPQGYYPPPGYYPPQGYAPLPAKATNGLAIASLVLGLMWMYWLGSILALVLGYVARKQIREQNQSGAGMALAGIVLGWVGVAILLLSIVFLAVPAFLDPGMGY